MAKLSASSGTSDSSEVEHQAHGAQVDLAARGIADHGIGIGEDANEGAGARSARRRRRAEEEPVEKVPDPGIPSVVVRHALTNAIASRGTGKHCTMTVGRISRAHRLPDGGDHRDAVSARGGLADRRDFRLHGPAAAGPPGEAQGLRIHQCADRRICELRPDLVLGFSDLQADIAAALVRAGIEVHLFNHRSVAEVLRMMRTLGAMIGCEAKARALAAQTPGRAHRRASTSATLRRRPRVYFEEWDDPLISGIRWVSELIAMAGGEDCFPGARRRTPRARPHHRRSARSAAPRPRHHFRLVVRQEIPSGARARACGLGGGTRRA